MKKWQIDYDEADGQQTRSARQVASRLRYVLYDCKVSFVFNKGNASRVSLMAFQLSVAYTVSQQVLSSMLRWVTVWPQQTWAENWRAVPLWGGELGPHLTQFGESRGLPPCQANFHLDPYSRLATIDMDRELYGRRQSLRP